MKQSFFKAAKKVMEESTFSGRTKIGCAVVYKGTILATAANTDKTSPLQRKYND